MEKFPRNLLRSVVLRVGVGGKMGRRFDSVRLGVSFCGDSDGDGSEARGCTS